MSARAQPTGSLLGIAVALAIAGGSAAACKVINPEHCANQADPGNVWCQALSQSTPYCSPCDARFHGCVSFEPVACADYDPVAMTGQDVDDDDMDGGTGTGTGVDSG